MTRYRRYAFVGGIILLITAWFSAGWHQCDEYYQILEFGSYKLGITPPGDLAWEFGAHMRPALQPLLVVLVHHLFQVFGSTDPFLITFVLRLCSAALFWTAAWSMLKAYIHTVRDVTLQRWFCALSYLLWISVYNGVRFSSESWSGSLFTIGFGLLMRDRTTTRNWLITGTIFGLAFVVRFQTALLVAGIMSWAIVIERAPLKKITVMTSGIIAALALGMVVDRWFYGEWVLSQWNYFVENILHGKAESFGVDPWYSYFAQTIERGIPPTSLIYVAAPVVLLVFARREPITWAVLPFVVGHVLIGHKELRFLFPLLGLMPLAIIQALDLLRSNAWPRLLEARSMRWAAGYFWVTNLIILAVVMFKPADDQLPMYKKLYHDYPGPIAIYHTGMDPFDRARPMHFYCRAEWELRGAFTDTLHQPEHAPFLVATISPDDVLKRWPSGRIVYRALPEWTKKFNVNGWLDRTDQWYVVEVQP